MSLKNVNKTAANTVELQIEISPEDFEKAIQATYIKERKKISIPGFRKGKAPRKLIEREYGENFFWQDAVNDIADMYISDAIKEAGLEIVTNPNAEVNDISKENGVLIKAVCTTKPEVKIEGYKGIEVEKVVNAVTDEDVDNKAAELCEKNSRLVSVDDRAAQLGDIVTIDFKGYKDDVAFADGAAEDYELELGSGQFIPGFEDQIVGHNTDEEFKINVTFPEEYQVEELAGADTVFEIKLKEIRYKEVPALDDDLVKDSTEFETVDEYKADLRKQLTEDAEKAADVAVENKILDTLIEKLEADIPQVMFDNQIDNMLRDLAGRLMPQGITLEQYFRYTGQSLDSVKTMYEDQAQKQVKLRLALEKIAELEDIQVSDDEINEEYQKIADAYSMDIERVKAMVAENDIRKDLAVGKAVDVVKEAAVIK